MHQKTIYITIGILAVLGIALFVGGFILIQQGKIPGVEPLTTSKISPFGGGSSRDTGGAPTIPSISRDGEKQEAAEPLKGGLRQISSRPVAGAVVFEKDGKTFIRYIEKQTGHVYEIGSGGARAERISNTTVPGIQKILWGASGENLIFQYLENNNAIKTVAANIAISTTTGSNGALNGTFLPDNIHNLSISPSGQDLFYILSLGNAAIGTISKIDGSSKKQIFESAIVGWIPKWVDTNTITLLPKPSALVRGFLYTLNSKTGVLSKLLGDVPGLTALVSHDKSKVIFSASASDSFETFLHRTGTRGITAFPITTLPEKCAWSKDDVTLFCGAPRSVETGDYPDFWYQGKVSFSDTIWKINTETGALNILAIPEDDARTEIDLIDPELSLDETLLIFRNKKDSSLWSLKIRP